jgi:twinkle protein
MTESVVLYKGACDECGSSDACAVYDDDHSHCFSCGKTSHAGVKALSQATSKKRKASMSDPIEMKGTVKGIAERSITKSTCEKYGVTQEPNKHYYPYCNEDGTTIAYKMRAVEEKEFASKGDLKGALLFGQHLFSKGGKSVTITEGELDAMAAFQMQGSLYPCVSLKNGAQAALKDIKANFEWLNSFDAIVICFDADEPGRKAAKAVSELLGAKCKVFKHSAGYKDACDYLKDDSQKAFMADWWRAEEYKPEGIVTVNDVFDDLMVEDVEGLPWAFPFLTKATFGRREGELYGFGAGVGVGKTDVFTQMIAFDIEVLKLNVGVIYLEQGVKETVKRVAGKIAGKLYHIPNGLWTPAEYLASVEKLRAQNQLFMTSHFGAMDWAAVKGQIEYFAKTKEIKVIYLDHLTALAAAEEDERRGLDKIMSEMAAVALELGIIIHYVSHLTTPKVGSHEEGARVLEKEFTGSRSIARWTHFMIGLERDKQDPDIERRSITTVRILKDRFTGQSTGWTSGLRYNCKTGILTECAPPADKDEPL